jgi:hypothetical protein
MSDCLGLPHGEVTGTQSMPEAWADAMCRAHGQGQEEALADVMAGRITLWQPIETAPKDGTRLLLWNGHRRILAWYARYSDTSEGWHRQNLSGEPLGLRTDLVEDTHWMLFPAPPLEGK